MASLATLYVALMTTQLLEGLGSTKLVLVDGVFAESKTFMALLARLLPDREVFSIQRTAGSAHGAASLVLQDRAPRLKLKEIAAATLRGLDDYRGVETVYFFASHTRRMDIEDLVARLAGVERRVPERYQTVQVAAVIPQSRTRGMVKVHDARPVAMTTEFGSTQKVTPTAFSAAASDVDLVITRWFHHP